MQHLNIILVLLFLNYFISLTILSKNLLQHKNDAAEFNEFGKSILFDVNDINKKHYSPNIDYNITLSAIDFNFNEDSFAFLHIQKTSGSAWELHILNHLYVKKEYSMKWIPLCAYFEKNKRYACRKNKCNKPIFWDRYASILCDMHADYTELNNCVMYSILNRIHFPFQILKPCDGVVHMTTFLRDPVIRYISEFEHIKRGATWSKAIRSCTNQLIYKEKCYKTGNWTNATWDDYLECEFNLANNRQVRMLANYNLLGCNVLKCWTKSSNCTNEEREYYEEKLLQNAKQTLLNMPFFGLAEYQELSEYLFLKIFGENKFKFIKTVTTNNRTTDYYMNKLGGFNNLKKIRENNHLDIKLYEFAKGVFFQKVKFFQNKEKMKTKNIIH